MAPTSGFYAIYDAENQGVKLVDDQGFEQVKDVVTSGKPNIDSIDYEKCREIMRFKPLRIRRLPLRPSQPNDLLAVYEPSNQSVIAITRVEYEKNKSKYNQGEAPTLKPRAAAATVSAAAPAPSLTPAFSDAPAEKPIEAEKQKPVAAPPVKEIMNSKALESLEVIRQQMFKEMELPLGSANLQREIAEMKQKCLELLEQNKEIFWTDFSSVAEVVETKNIPIRQEVKEPELGETMLKQEEVEMEMEQKQTEEEEALMAEEALAETEALLKEALEEMAQKEMALRDMLQQAVVHRKVALKEEMAPREREDQQQMLFGEEEEKNSMLLEEERLSMLEVQKEADLETEHTNIEDSLEKMVSDEREVILAEVPTTNVMKLEEEEEVVGKLDDTQELVQCPNEVEPSIKEEQDGEILIQEQGSMVESVVEGQSAVDTTLEKDGLIHPLEKTQSAQQPQNMEGSITESQDINESFDKTERVDEVIDMIEEVHESIEKNQPEIDCLNETVVAHESAKEMVKIADDGLFGMEHALSGEESIACVDTEGSPSKVEEGEAEPYLHEDQQAVLDDVESISAPSFEEITEAVTQVGAPVESLIGTATLEAETAEEEEEDIIKMMEEIKRLENMLETGVKNVTEELESVLGTEEEGSSLSRVEAQLDAVESEVQYANPDYEPTHQTEVVIPDISILITDEEEKTKELSPESAPIQSYDEGEMEMQEHTEKIESTVEALEVENPACKAETVDVQSFAALLFQPPKIDQVELSPDDLLAVYDPATQSVIAVKRSQYEVQYCSHCIGKKSQE